MALDPIHLFFHRRCPPRQRNAAIGIGGCLHRCGDMQRLQKRSERFRLGVAGWAQISGQSSQPARAPRSSDMRSWRSEGRSESGPEPQTEARARFSAASPARARAALRRPGGGDTARVHPLGERSRCPTQRRSDEGEASTSLDAVPSAECGPVPRRWRDLPRVCFDQRSMTVSVQLLTGGRQARIIIPIPDQRG